MMVEVLPILVNGEQAANPRLYKLAKEFCDEHFGVDSIDFRKHTNVWAAVEGGEGLSPKVIGIAGLRVVLDLPVLHTDCGSVNRDRAVSAKLIQRIWSSILDRGFEGQDMLIHVASDQEWAWRDFLDGIKAIPADRHIVRVHPKIEV